MMRACTVITSHVFFVSTMKICVILVIHQTPSSSVIFTFQCEAAYKFYGGRDREEEV